MIDNFENDEEIEFEDADFDDEFTPEQIAQIKRAEQDANMGFTYEMLKDDEGDFVFKCSKCGRVGGVCERPFPHKLNCPMRNFGEGD